MNTVRTYAHTPIYLRTVCTTLSAEHVVEVVVVTYSAPYLLLSVCLSVHPSIYIYLSIGYILSLGRLSRDRVCDSCGYVSLRGEYSDSGREGGSSSDRHQLPRKVTTLREEGGPVCQRAGLRFS